MAGEYSTGLVVRRFGKGSFSGNVHFRHSQVGLPKSVSVASSVFQLAKVYFTSVLSGYVLFVRC